MMEPTRQFSHLPITHQPLFHGTTRDLPIGGTVHPNMAPAGFGAYATTHPDHARAYAQTDQSWRSQMDSPNNIKGKYEQLPLFGTVYKVSPLAGDTVSRGKEMNASTTRTSQRGFRVTGVQSHVIPAEQEQLLANRAMRAEAASKVADDNPDER